MLLYHFRANRSPYTFLGFGQGPRSCIGMRFALLETKVCLARVLAKFSFEECEGTPDEVTRDPISVFGNPVEDMLVRVVERQAY